jgi:hypothetical protein
VSTVDHVWILRMLAAAAAVVTLGTTSLAAAEERDVASSEPPKNPVEDAARAGSFQPLTLPASVIKAHGFAMAYGGYDSAGRNARLVSYAEARVYGPFALRFGAQSNTVTGEVAPSLGGRVQFLSQANHELDAAAFLAYNAEGFTELEGELEGGLALGRSFGNWQLLLNLVYGQDFEGRERDGEVRTSVLYHLPPRYHFGIDGRARFDLGEEEEGTVEAHHEPRFDVDVGPVVSVTFGPLVAGLHAGFAAIQFEGSQPRYGVVALGGLGAAL